MSDFTRDGYVISLGVITVGELPTVGLEHRGNIVLSKLPVPPGSRVFIDSPVSLAYSTQVAAPATSTAITKLLTDIGWAPYGKTEESLSFKQKAMRLDVMVVPP